MVSIITPTYKQIDKLEIIKPIIEKWNVEWTLAIDGCKQTKKWAEDNKIDYVYQDRFGRRYNEICNIAAEQVEGDYILFINGDSIPKRNYLESITEEADPNRIICGLRINVDEKMKIVSSDHRLKMVKIKESRPFKVENWEAQTSNGMLVHKDLWEKLRGFDTIYKGYGVVDQDFCMRAHYEGVENWWAPRAVLYHMHQKRLNNTKGNYEIYEERKADYSV